MTDTSATIRARYGYNPYGVRTKPTGNSDADFGFTGRFVLATQPEHTFTLDRLYRPDLASWLSKDPLKSKLVVNLFAYVAQRPFNDVDPLRFIWRRTDLWS